MARQMFNEILSLIAGATGAACASMTEAVVRCDGAARRTHSNKFRQPRVATNRFGGSAEHPAAHSSGRSRAQLTNLANITAYVVARIVLVPLSGQASGEFQIGNVG